MADNNAELRVLSGAALVANFSFSDGWGDTAALLLSAGSFRDLRPAPVGDIVRVAREHLSEGSAALRRSSRVDLSDPGALKTSLEKQVAAVQSAFQAAGAPTTFAQPVASAFQGLASSTLELLRWAQEQRAQQSMRHEESDVLWWLFAEQSRDLRTPLIELKASAPLIAAKEMADLTRTLPGPYAARAFLDKAVRGAQLKVPTVSLAEAVGACPAEWRQGAAGRPDIDPVEDLCPTCFALRKAVEAEGKKTWHQVFHTVTGLEATHKMDAVDLAQQAYEEWLAVKAVASRREAK